MQQNGGGGGRTLAIQMFWTPLPCRGGGLVGVACQNNLKGSNSRFFREVVCSNKIKTRLISICFNGLQFTSEDMWHPIFGPQVCTQNHSKVLNQCKTHYNVLYPQRCQSTYVLLLQNQSFAIVEVQEWGQLWQGWGPTFPPGATPPLSLVPSPELAHNLGVGHGSGDRPPLLSWIYLMGCVLFWMCRNFCT